MSQPWPLPDLGPFIAVCGALLPAVTRSDLRLRLVTLQSMLVPLATLFQQPALLFDPAALPLLGYLILARCVMLPGVLRRWRDESGSRRANSTGARDATIACLLIGLAHLAVHAADPSGAVGASLGTVLAGALVASVGRGLSLPIGLLALGNGLLAFALLAARSLSAAAVIVGLEVAVVAVVYLLVRRGGEALGLALERVEVAP